MECTASPPVGLGQIISQSQMDELWCAGTVITMTLDAAKTNIRVNGDKGGYIDSNDERRVKNKFGRREKNIKK